MKIFDKAKYHSDGDFPVDLSQSQAYLPGGMFVAWCARTGMLSAQTLYDFKDEYDDLVSRTKSPCSLYRAFGGVFLDSLLNESGLSFAKAYFDFETGTYLDDYIGVLAEDLPTAYHVADTWENYDRLASVIDARYHECLSKNK